MRLTKVNSRIVRHREARSDVAISSRLELKARLLHYVRNDETLILRLSYWE
mgnify:CR=1 FL=1